jgi:glyoxalase-like protein
MALDHLVVACRTLEAGRAWCEANFGVAPAPGGRHAMMGTHNLLLAIGSARFPKSYLELIAIDPDAPVPPRPRWFDLDDGALQAAIADTPRLVHWGARSDDIDATVAAFRALGCDPGSIADAERMTSRGLLRWRITLSEGGHRLHAGALPLWIQWGDEHPADTLPASGVALEAFELGALPPELAAPLASLASIAAPGLPAAPLRAVLNGRRGRVTLTAPPPPTPAPPVSA